MEDQVFVTLYQIRNTVTDQKYIGITNSYDLRKIQHQKLLRIKSHHCLALQVAWSKFGEDKFVFEIAYQVPFIDNAQRRLIEKVAILTNDNIYNTASITQQKRDRIEAFQERLIFSPTIEVRDVEIDCASIKEEIKPELINYYYDDQEDQCNGCDAVTEQIGLIDLIKKRQHTVYSVAGKLNVTHNTVYNMNKNAGKINLGRLGEISDILEIKACCLFTNLYYETMVKKFPVGCQIPLFY